MNAASNNPNSNNSNNDGENGFSNAGSRGGENHLNGFYAYKNTFERDVTWVEIPRTLRFHHITDPYRDDLGGLEEGGSGGGGKGHNDRRQGDGEGIPPTYWSPEQQWCAPATGLNTHGLEALSAAALSAPAPPQARMLPYSSSSISAGEEGRVTSPEMAIPGATTVTGAAAGPIDPSLMGTRPAEVGSEGKGNVEGEGVEDAGEMDRDERRMEALLRGLSQESGQWDGGERGQSGEGS